MDTVQNGIAQRLRDDAALAELLPGGVWTRRIARNTNGPDMEPVPGSTPTAFDEAGRIRRCAAVLYAGTSRSPIGPETAYTGYLEIWLRCLPHESEKARLHEAARRMIALLDGAVLPGPDGEGIVLTVAGRMMPDDDPDLTPAVVDMIRVQTDSVWRVA